MANVLRAPALVERPTLAQLRSIGMTVIPPTGLAVSQRPTTFNLRDPQGYFVTVIVRRMNEEKESGERNSHRAGGPRPNNPRVCASPGVPGFPGPPVTPAEIRIDGKDAPKTPSGNRI